MEDEKAITLEPFPLPQGYARRMDLDLLQPCWPWLGIVRRTGYGYLTIEGDEKSAHRLAYQLHVGPIPRGWEVDHVCHSLALRAGLCPGGICSHRACWNPAHLEAVSHDENRRRGNHFLFSPARRERCKRNHDLTDPANIYTRKDGRRRCHPCMLITAREWRTRRTPA